MDERTAIRVTHPAPAHPLATDEALRHRLLAQARRWFGHSGEAEELVQDAYLRTADGVLPLSMSSREAWLVTVLRHLCVDAWRRNRRYQAILGQMAADWVHGPDPGMSEDLVDRDRRVGQALKKLVTTLSPGDAMVVMLYEVWGCTHAELGDMTGLTDVASRQRLRRAMQRLRDGHGGHAADSEDRAALLALLRHALVTRDCSGLVAALRADSPRVMAVQPDPAALPRGLNTPRTTWCQLGNVMGLLVRIGDGPATLVPLCEASAEAA